MKFLKAKSEETETRVGSCGSLDHDFIWIMIFRRLRTVLAVKAADSKKKEGRRLPRQRARA
jgi:hypothetical protein